MFVVAMALCGEQKLGLLASWNCDVYDIVMENRKQDSKSNTNIIHIDELKIKLLYE